MVKAEGLSQRQLIGFPWGLTLDEPCVGRQDYRDKVNEEAWLHGGEWLDMDMVDIHGCHLRCHCCQLCSLNLYGASRQLKPDCSAQGNADGTLGVDSSSHQ